MSITQNRAMERGRWREGREAEGEGGGAGGHCLRIGNGTLDIVVVNRSVVPFPFCPFSLTGLTIVLLYLPTIFFFYSTFQTLQRTVIGSRDKCKYP